MHKGLYNLVTKRPVSNNKNNPYVSSSQKTKPTKAVPLSEDMLLSGFIWQDRSQNIPCPKEKTFGKKTTLTTKQHCG